MAEFIVPQPQVLMLDECIELSKIPTVHGSKWCVYCSWIRDGKEESGQWEIENDNIEEAYMLWRKNNWVQLFDPFKVRIISLEIKRI